MCQTTPDNRFVSLKAPQRVWAVSSIHGEAQRLTDLHDCLLERIAPGDRLVYLGNYTGYGPHSREAVDELLTFRRLVLSLPGMIPNDIVYLRGGQEDLWQRLMQLHFSQAPVDTLLWMLGNGMGAALQDYGICHHDGIVAAREGIISLTRWTTSIRASLRQNPGHDIFMAQHRRAAFTHLHDNETEEDRYPILFVHAGIDRAKTLQDQGDSLWWSGECFNDMNEAYRPFEKVIRGFDPKHQGININCVTASLDGGCGFGGALVCAGMDAGGDVFELLEA